MRISQPHLMLKGGCTDPKIDRNRIHRKLVGFKFRAADTFSSFSHHENLPHAENDRMLGLKIIEELQDGCASTQSF